MTVIAFPNASRSGFTWAEIQQEHKIHIQGSIRFDQGKIQLLYQ